MEIDYRDQEGRRSWRAIEAYSFRRTQAGDVLLMAVRADNAQPRSYLVNSILGVRAYPIAILPAIPHWAPHSCWPSEHSAGDFKRKRRFRLRIKTSH